MLKQWTLAGPLNPYTICVDPSTRAVTREQLVERLHKRIELLRAKRHADEVAATAKKSQTWQAEKKKESKKRKPVAAASANGVQNESEAPSKRSKSAAENISSVSGSEQVCSWQSGE